MLKALVGMDHGDNWFQNISEAGHASIGARKIFTLYQKISVIRRRCDADWPNSDDQWSVYGVSVAQGPPVDTGAQFSSRGFL